MTISNSILQRWFRPSEQRESPARSFVSKFGLLVLLALPACNSIDAKVYNLDQLHHDDGRISYSAALMSDGEFLLRRAFSASAPLGKSFEFPDRDEEFVSDPSGACLELLLDLESFSSRDLYNLALLTEIYAWLAVGDPYILSRERCVLALGQIGRSLGVARPLSAPAEEEQPTAEELGDKLADLIAAFAAQMGQANSVDSVTAPGSEPSNETQATAAPELEAACQALAQLDYGITAGRRILRTGAVLIDSAPRNAKEFEPLRDLVRDVAQRMTAIALGEASNDEKGIVRAAAIHAWVECTGNRVGELLVAALRDQDPLVMHQLMREITKHGLPQSEHSMDAEELRQWKRNWISNLVTVSRTPLNGEVSIAACQALHRVTGAGFESLRTEDWVDWWEDQLQSEIGEDRVRKVEP